MPTSIVWFRRDLRLADHPALAAAARRGPVIGLFVLDPVPPVPFEWLAPPREATTDRLPAAGTAAALPSPGEAAAHARADAFFAGVVDHYAERRNRPDLEGTSRLSPYLRWGCLHPRQ